MKKWCYKILHTQVGLIILLGNNDKANFKLKRVFGVNLSAEITLKSFLSEIKRLEHTVPEDLLESLKNCGSNKKLSVIIEGYFKEIGFLSDDSNIELANIAYKVKEYFLNKSEIYIHKKLLDIDSLTEFQKDVLTTLIKIPFAETVSYSELAKISGHPNAQRAVGTVMRNNPFPIIIPCHRVIRSDGKIGEFALGIEMKAKLLKHEEVNYK